MLEWADEGAGVWDWSGERRWVSWLCWCYNWYQLMPWLGFLGKINKTRKTRVIQAKHTSSICCQYFVTYHHTTVLWQLSWDHTGACEWHVCRIFLKTGWVVDLKEYIFSYISITQSFITCGTSGRAELADLLYLNEGSEIAGWHTGHISWSLV